MCQLIIKILSFFWSFRENPFICFVCLPLRKSGDGNETLLKLEYWNLICNVIFKLWGFYEIFGENPFIESLSFCPSFVLHVCYSFSLATIIQIRKKWKSEDPITNTAARKMSDLFCCRLYWNKTVYILKRYKKKYFLANYPEDVPLAQRDRNLEHNKRYLGVSVCICSKARFRITVFSDWTALVEFPKSLSSCSYACN